MKLDEVLGWKRKKTGFTLVELLIVMVILGILMMMLVGTLNPVALMGKARDAGRKKDLEKIKRTFEEFYNDKGHYPYIEMTFCNLRENCGAVIPGMGGYLDRCLCDGKKNPYTLFIDPSWFKVVTNLENLEDKDIPEGWYVDERYVTYLDKSKVNYGVSSSNVLWYERTLGSDCDPSVCFSTEFCNNIVGSAGCNEKRDHTSCYLNRNLEGGRNICNDPVCQVECCGGGCDD